MNITLPAALKKRIEAKTFSLGISASRWFEQLVRAELARGGRAK